MESAESAESSKTMVKNYITGLVLFDLTVPDENHKSGLDFYDSSETEPHNLHCYFGLARLAWVLSTPRESLHIAVTWLGLVAWFGSCMEPAS